jgi:hypothetical protein
MISLLMTLMQSWMKSTASENLSTYQITITPMITYKQLLTELNKLTEEQLNSDVCVFDTAIDEYFQLNVEFVYATDAQDVLDVDHPIIRF